MKATLEAINQMQANGIIGKYAIGGAVGATFYLAPAATVDLDVFVTLPGVGGSLLVSLSPIYEFLKAKGGQVQDEYVIVGGWPVQFLLPSDPVEEEAVRDAVAIEVEGASARVMTAEHLIVIALKTGRAKDHSRILQFVEQAAYDSARLNEILVRHHLSPAWSRFTDRFLKGPS